MNECHYDSKEGKWIEESTEKAAGREIQDCTTCAELQKEIDHLNRQLKEAKSRERMSFAENVTLRSRIGELELQLNPSDRVLSDGATEREE